MTISESGPPGGGVADGFLLYCIGHHDRFSVYIQVMISKDSKILVIENSQLTCALSTVMNASAHKKKSYMSPYCDRGEHPPRGLVGREDCGRSPNLKFTSSTESSHLRKSDCISGEYVGLGA